MRLMSLLILALLTAVVPGSSIVRSTASAQTSPAAIRVGTFAELRATVVPSDVSFFEISGRSVPGDGAAGAEFAYDVRVDAAYVAANPHTAVLDAAGRGFRFVGTRVTPWLFGATGTYTRDRTTGTPETAIPVDNSAALERFFAYLATVDRPVDADWRGNWGISRTLVIDQPRWNRQRFIAGQLWALAPMEDMVQLSLNGSRLEGRLVLIGGAGWSDDVSVYADRKAVNGVRLINNLHAHIDQIQVANVSGWAVYDDPDIGRSNNIDLGIDHVKVFGAGASPVSHRLHHNDVAFSNRSDTGEQNSFDQMSVLRVADSSSLTAGSLVKIGALPYLLVDKPSATSVRVYPWLGRGETSGRIESMQGGAVLFQNNNAAGVNIGRISAQNCGIGYWSRGLYAPTVGALETQYCGTAMAFGMIDPTTGPADRHKANLGNRVDGHHSEMNGFDIVQVNQMATGTIGEPTALGHDGVDWAAGIITLRHRLSDLSLSNSGGFYGFGIARNGVRHSARAGTIGTRQAGTARISNERGQGEPVFVADNFELSLVWSEEYSRAFPGQIDARATIIGTGANRQPTGTIRIVAGQPGYTVNGRASLSINAQPGRVQIIAVKQDLTNNWLVSW